MNRYSRKGVWYTYKKKVWSQTVRKVKTDNSDYSIEDLSRLFDKTRQAFHQIESRQIEESVNNEIVLVHVTAVRQQQPRIGTRKLYSMLKDVCLDNDIRIGRDKFFKLLGANNLLVPRRRRNVKTTDSNHVYTQYQNLIKNYVPSGPEQIWACDITYLYTIEDGFVYLSLVTDQYSKRVMGFSIQPTLEAIGPLMAMRMALRNRSKEDINLIHHSDRGIQYCCGEYVELLENNNIQISMSAKGNPYDNAIAERVNGILKSEFYLDRAFRSIEQAKAVVSESIEIYNVQRLHASCDYLTPMEAHSRSGLLKKRWKSYKYKKRTNVFAPISEDIKKAVEQLINKESLRTKVRV